MIKIIIIIIIIIIILEIRDEAERRQVLFLIKSIY